VGLQSTSATKAISSTNEPALMNIDKIQVVMATKKIFKKCKTIRAIMG